MLEKFTSYCNPRKNITILRHKFFTYKQVEGQSFNDFVTELKKHGSECEFGELTTSLTKDMIVCGVADNTLRERLLRDGDLTLEKAIAAGHAAEETKRHAQENQLIYTKSIVQRTTNRDVLTRNPNNPTIPSTSVNSVAAPTNEENVLHMVKDAISATAKTTLKPVVPRRKLTVLLKRTAPFLANR